MNPAKPATALLLLPTLLGCVEGTKPTPLKRVGAADAPMTRPTEPPLKEPPLPDPVKPQGDGPGSPTLKAKTDDKPPS
jgi:hypothetical protein